MVMEGEAQGVEGCTVAEGCVGGRKMLKTEGQASRERIKGCRARPGRVRRRATSLQGPGKRTWKPTWQRPWALRDKVAVGQGC